MTADNIMYQREQYQSASLSHVAGLRLRTQLLGKVPARLLMLLLVAGALLMAACGSSSGTASGIDRHGLPDNVPLPDGSTFQRMLNRTQDSGTVAQEWYWTVASPNVPNTVQGFYVDNLPKNGWTYKQTLPGNGPADLTVIGCQANQVLFAEVNLSFQVVSDQGDSFTVTAPSGGSALRIETSKNPNDLSAYCS